VDDPERTGCDDQGQKNAVYHVLRSCDFLTGIEGEPGVGKTSTINEAAAAIRSLTGQDLVMLAPTARTVAKVREEGFEADTGGKFKGQAGSSGRGGRQNHLVRRG
jgi:AAA domain